MTSNSGHHPFESPALDPGTASFCPDLPFGLLAFSGPDAEAFLQGQLSNNLNDLPAGMLQLSSHNSPKGRMLATLLIWRDGASSFRALVSADLAETLRKRLSMYVLRSKVSVLDLSPSHALFGVGGAAAGEAVRAAFGAAPNPGHVLAGETSTMIALPDGRIVIAVPGESAESVHDKLAAVATRAPLDYWRWLGIRAGVAMIVAATQDNFVLQAANWDVMGGVSFQKGCYTGQEIIARTQYLGRLKERMHLFHVDGPPPLPGSRLFGAVFGDQACGTVVDAAPAPESGSDLLAVVQMTALDGPLHVGTPEGPVLTPRALPYSLPSPAAPNRPKL